MRSQDDQPPSGPVEAQPWPSRLRGHVVTPGARPRVHGYDLQRDLAKHYGFGETQLLTLTGDLPSAEAARAFEVAMVFLSPISVAQAPAHAAGLAQLCGSPASGTLCTAAMTLAQQAEHALAHLGPLRAWSSQPHTPWPGVLTGEDPADTDAVASLQSLLPDGFAAHPVFSHHPRLRVALLAVLMQCGLRRRHQLMTVWILARLPAVSAEAFCVEPGQLEDYPMDLPPYRYSPPRGGHGETSHGGRPEDDEREP